MEFIPAFKNYLEFRSAEGHSFALHFSALPVHPETPGCGFQLIKLQDLKSKGSKGSPDHKQCIGHGWTWDLWSVFLQPVLSRTPIMNIGLCLTKLILSV